MGAEMMTSICGCMNSKGQAGQYAFQSYPKIPFLGPIGSYLSLLNNNQGKGIASNFSNMISSIGNNKSILPSFPNQGILPSIGGFNLANLVSNLPLNIFKANQNILNLNNDVLVKKIKKSSYDEAKGKLNAGQNFKDSQFPPQMSSLGNLPNGKANQITWKRVGEIITNPVFVSDKIQPNDILQGALGNCYFLSAISAIAEADFRIKNIFPNLQINPNGIYMARVLHNGTYQQVVVDDYFPVNRDGSVSFAKPAGGKEIWVMILQKCYAKLYGSYAVVVGGLPIQTLHAFTSAPVLNRSLNNDASKMQQVWKEMLDLYNKGALICCGTKGDASIENEGFVKSHAYTILGVHNQPYKLLKIRNPWGHKEWKGRASDYDTAFWQQMNPADKQKLGYDDHIRKQNSDGIFFMIWEDFLKYFQLLNFCKINDNASYNFLQSNFDYLVPKLFEFQIGPATDAINLTSFALTQESNRGKGQDVEKRGYSRSFMILGKLDPQTNKYIYINSNSNKSFPDNFLEVQDIEAGKYRLYARYLWNNGRGTNPAVVSAYSPSKISIIELTDNPSQFLQQVFYDHAVKNGNNKKKLDDNNNWICSDILLGKGGFGYLVANIDKNSKNKLSITVEQAQYNQKQLQLIQPRKGTGRIVEEVRGGNPFILLFNLAVEKFPQSITLPQPKVAQME